MKKKGNQGNYWLRKPTLLLSPKKEYWESKKTQISQTSPETVDTSKNIKNDTDDRADKSRSVIVTNLSNKITQIEKPQKWIFTETLKLFLICLDKDKFEQVRH